MTINIGMLAELHRSNWRHPILMPITPPGRAYLATVGWNHWAVAFTAFCTNPSMFRDQLLSQNICKRDVQLIITYMFSSLFPTMKINVGWCEGDSVVTYKCTLHEMDRNEKTQLEAARPTTTEWLDVENAVRRQTGPWSVTSAEFTGDEDTIVLFDPFEDTWSADVSDT